MKNSLLILWLVASDSELFLVLVIAWGKDHRWYHLFDSIFARHCFVLQVKVIKEHILFRQDEGGVF